MQDFKIAKLQDLKEKKGFFVKIEGEEIVLFKLNEKICAISNICPHQKFSKLHEGEFKNGIVTCPMHGWAYDVRTGISTNASPEGAGGKVKCYPTIVKEKNIYLQVE